MAAVFKALLPTLAQQWFNINDLGDLIAWVTFFSMDLYLFTLATLLVCFVVSIFSRGF